MKNWKKKMEENEVLINEELLSNDIDNIVPEVIDDDYLHPEIGPDIGY